MFMILENKQLKYHPRSQLLRIMSLFTSMVCSILRLLTLKRLHITLSKFT